MEEKREPLSEMAIERKIQILRNKHMDSEVTGIHIDETISLLDPRNGLMPRDLIVLFFELQKHYKIKFVEQDIIANRFDYLDNIVKAVEDKLK